MFQVRFHGRGGQGVVTAAELLALAAFREDRHAQAFPSFGCERMGAPVMSFRRIDFGARFGRGSGGLIVVALGSVLGTVKDAIDELRDDGVRVGAVGITTYRPFPAQAVRDDIRTALATGDSGPRHAIVRTVIAGLGGRPVTRDSLRRMLTSAERGELPAFSFLDLDMGLVAGEPTRIRATRRSGPSAENILRDLVGRA